MKKILTTTIATGLAFAAISSRADLNFAGINDVQFNGSGDSFQLNPISASAANPQFMFTGAGDTGLNGWITGAPWLVNVAGLTSTTVGGITYQQAPVEGGGVLNISDGTSILTGNLMLLQIHTLSNGQGGVADSLSINLTDLSYTGSNPDLLALVAGKEGNLNLTFQFSGNDPNLSNIFAPGAGETLASYSGSISAAVSPVPEPSTFVDGALVILPFGAAALRRLRQRKDSI